ncbi:AAA family ATPase [Bengtsoniella intestinalis]|uniref:AAA family ATPase n=1 Tax=Bengtsoniella intestinalis TaxID=3073143 RepID=UPI00391EE3CC
MKKFNTITTAELYAKHIERTPFIVEELLPRGLTILGGLGKVGKSWFSFWLAMQVAKGEPIWNFKTTKGTTLYLAFEDNEERLQDRLFMLSDEIENAPPNAHLCIEISKMGGELESRIRNFITDHPDTNLIIIDTLQKVRGNIESNYISDYEDITILKNLADEFKIAIVLVHHLRKQKDSDIFNQITGSTGLQGAADTMMVIEQTKRGEDFATFHLTGRDVKSRELELERGEDNIWLLLSDSLHELNIKDKKFVDAIKNLMAGVNFWSTNPTELSTLVSEHSGDYYSNKMITKVLRRLAKSLENLDIYCNIRKSNGYRIIDISKSSGESGDKNRLLN